MDRREKSIKSLSWRKMLSMGNNKVSQERKKALKEKPTQVNLRTKKARRRWRKKWLWKKWYKIPTQGINRGCWYHGNYISTRWWTGGSQFKVGWKRCIIPKCSPNGDIGYIFYYFIFLAWRVICRCHFQNMIIINLILLEIWFYW